MKILIFEYITGGGFCHTDLPASLAREGGLMLKALLDDFAALPAHEVVVMVDERCVAGLASKNSNLISVSPTDEVFAVFDKAVQNCDAVWIIAPETEHVLFDFAKRVEESKKLLLSPPSSAIAKTADKWQTFNLLVAHNILTIPTHHVDCYDNSIVFPVAIKPVDGVGCENSFFLQNFVELKQTLQKITPLQNYIIQPFISGDTLSLSAIFKHGQAQLLCVNRQVIKLENRQFLLSGCKVNLVIDDKTEFQNLLNNIAKAFPDLFGYVGIDLIVSESAFNNCYVVEINPRLTSSYSGIRQALGINVAELVLQSVNDTTTINPLRNQTVFIDLVQE